MPVNNPVTRGIREDGTLTDRAYRELEELIVTLRFLLAGQLVRELRLQISGSLARATIVCSQSLRP